MYYRPLVYTHDCYWFIVYVSYGNIHMFATIISAHKALIFHIQWSVCLVSVILSFSIFGTPPTPPYLRTLRTYKRGGEGGQDEIIT